MISLKNNMVMIFIRVDELELSSVIGFVIENYTCFFNDE